ncbi:MAG TPA: peptidoglycan bridge formation glycyltransferase FemA/FemB family protein, partial [Candidatus Dojkabacteria bacterium]|nr:peptidoglycan bridge formation glycyltransferase FemA/FemB family protein [Candidatus Dojkabacteria bacterium]
KNTRYYLKKAQKVGVEISISQDKDEFEEFLNMLEGIANKKDFNMLPKSYLRAQFELLIKDGLLKFFCAKYKGKPVAGGVFAFYNNESSYLHGASSDDVGDTQAPYLVQWEAIKHAKNSGMKVHNFWGVVEDKNYHPGYSGFGYSNFKKGFGGYLEEYMRTQDYAYNPIMYSLFRFNEWYRKVKYKGN